MKSSGAKLSVTAAVCGAAHVAASLGGAQEIPGRNVEGVMDNSFLIEEAYNQEAGVVQHILTTVYNLDKRGGRDDEEWEIAFTQEWPLFSQMHQVSYTIPYLFAKSDGDWADGFGDVALNYRYQAWFDERTLTALAPNVSLVLPTGDEDKGFGDDTVGYEFGLPFSTALGDRWFLHLNAGISYFPDAGSGPERDLTHYQLGASGIYAATPDLHFMLEWLGNWNHEAEPGQPRDREFASVISPGLRRAFNLANDRQLVLGLAAPLGLTGSAPDYAVFLYVSFEHFFARSD